jgi:hypothetical protein
VKEKGKGKKKQLTPKLPREPTNMIYENELESLQCPMTYHVRLEKKTGTPSLVLDTSEKLPELSRKTKGTTKEVGLVKSHTMFIRMAN